MAYKDTGIPKREIIDIEVGEWSLKINKPGKKEVWLAFKALASSSGEMDMLRAGEIIFETCSVGYDEEIVSNVPVYMAVCLDLAADYVTPADVQIKKKAAQP